MKLQEYLTLIDRFAASSLTRLAIEEETYKIHMEKAGRISEPAAVSDGPSAKQAVQPFREAESREAAGGRGEGEGAAAAGAEGPEEASYIPVKAPLVGVFYAAPSLEEAPFVQVGSQVEKGQILCLIEAMKMMNELQSPVSGIVRSIKGVDGQLAEYGQVLFEVEPC